MRTYIIPKLKKHECSTNKWYHPTIKHIHQDWEFTTSEGNVENIINGVAYKNIPSTFILLGPKHSHMQQSKGAISRRDICISSENFTKYCEELKPGLYEEINALHDPIQIHLPLNTYKEILERLENVNFYKTTNNTDETPILHSIITYFLGLYIEQSQIKDTPQPPAWFSAFMRKLQEPEYFTKKVEDLVKETNYTHAHFLAIFKQQTGQTLISYITSQRMNYATKLLINTSLPIIQIANQVGYDNHSFFTQKFREYFHLSPTAYRKKHTKSFSSHAEP